MAEIFRNDDLDTRRELLYMLSKLSRGERLAFLERAAYNSSRGLTGDPSDKENGVVHKVSDTTGGDPREIYWDLAYLMVQNGVQIDWIMATLGNWCRRKSKRLPIPSK